MRGEANPIIDITADFIIQWMPPTKALSYVCMPYIKHHNVYRTRLYKANVSKLQIYVPLHEDNGHWFLMVLSVLQRKVYKLDSNPNKAMTLERETRMHDVVCIIWCWTVITRFIIKI